MAVLELIEAAEDRGWSGPGSGDGTAARERPEVVRKSSRGAASRLKAAFARTEGSDAVEAEGSASPRKILAASDSGSQATPSAADESLQIDAKHWLYSGLSRFEFPLDWHLMVLASFGLA